MKRLSIMTVLALSAVLVFAAGGTEEPQPTTTAAGGMEKYSGEIVVSILASDYSQVAAESLIKAYNEYQPDVTVYWEPVSADYASWLTTQLAAGVVRPDIVSANYARSYENYVDFNKYRYAENPYTGHPWSEDFDFDHLDNPLTLSDGKRYLIGTQAVDIIWLYNADIFDAVGVNPPADWDEFASVCEKIKAASYVPIAINFTYQLPQWVNQAYWQQYNQPAKEIAKSRPGDYNYDPEVEYTWNVARFYRGIRDGEIRFDTPEMVEFITNLKKIFPQYATEDLYVLSDPYPLFLQQKAAVIVDGSWAIARTKRDMANLDDRNRLEELKINPDTKLKPFKWGVFPHPPMTGGLVNAPNRVFQSITGEYIGAIDKNQKQTDMVVDFIRFWISGPGYQAWIDGYLGGDRGWTPGGPLLVKDVSIPPEYQELLDSIGLDKKEGNPMTTPDRLLTTVVGGRAGMQTEAFELFRQVLDDEITPQQFAAGYQALVMDNFDKILDAINLAPGRLDSPERSPTE